MKTLLTLFIQDVKRAARIYLKPWTAWRELRERAMLERAWLENELWNFERDPEAYYMKFRDPR